MVGKGEKGRELVSKLRGWEVCGRRKKRGKDVSADEATSKDYIGRKWGRGRGANPEVNGVGGIWEVGEERTGSTKRLDYQRRKSSLKYQLMRKLSRTDK